MIELNGQKFEVKPLLYLDVVELGNIVDKREHALKLFELSGIPRDTSSKLNPKEGASLMEQINEINGFSDFQKTSSTDKSS